MASADEHRTDGIKRAEATMRASPAVCPRCGMADQSQAIAAIVAGGTQHAEGAEWDVGFAWTSDGAIPVTMAGETSTVQRTELARMLDLPEPSAPIPLTGCLAAFCFVAGAVVAAVAGVLTYLGSALLTADPTLTSFDTTRSVLNAVVAALVVGVVPVAIGGLWVLIGRWSSDRWEREYDVWLRAKPIADRLVYCARDHIVYDPANAGFWMRPERTRAYVMERAMTSMRPPPPRPSVDGRT